MQKIVRVAVLIGLILALGSVGMASAQSGVSYSSSFQVQNLDPDQATVALQYYDQATGNQVANPTYTIAGNSSRTFFPTDVTAGFNGSLVISSDRNIRAINNLTASGPADYFASTNGFQAGSTSLALPLLMCNNSGFDTWFNVQNTGTADANITINYVHGSAGADDSETATIKAGAAKTFSQATGSATKNCSTLAGSSGKFIGSATVTSTNGQPIAGVVMEVNTSNFKVLMGYGGFTGGAPVMALPLIMANNNGFYTAYQIQNADTTNADVTVTYGPNGAGGATPNSESFTLAPGASKTILNAGTAAQSGSVNDWTTLGKYVGGAVATSTGGKIVAIVNEQRAGSAAMGASYEGFDPATATAKISAPLIMSNNSTYYTSMQIQNVSLTGSANVTVTYGPNTGGTFAPAADTFTLAPGASKTLLHQGPSPANGSAVNNWNQKYIGSAVVTATGGNIVAIVNQQSLSRPGDQLASGDAFNIP